MKLILSAALFLSALALTARAEPTPVACGVAQEGSQCEAVAQADGRVGYAFLGTMRVSVYRNGVRRACTVIGGHDAGTEALGDVRAGDIVKVKLLSGEFGVIVAGAGSGSNSIGLSETSAC